MTRDHIFLVEDDLDTADRLHRALVEAFPTADLLWFPSSETLVGWLDEPGAVTPRVIIMDVMMRRTVLNDGGPSREDKNALIEGVGSADEGLNCATAVHMRASTRLVPIIYFSIRSADDLMRLKGFDEGTAHVQKGTGDIAELVRKLRPLLN